MDNSGAGGALVGFEHLACPFFKQNLCDGFNCPFSHSPAASTSKDEKDSVAVTQDRGTGQSKIFAAFWFVLQLLLMFGKKPQPDEDLEMGTSGGTSSIEGSKSSSPVLLAKTTQTTPRIENRQVESILPAPVVPLFDIGKYGPSLYSKLWDYILTPFQLEQNGFPMKHFFGGPTTFFRDISIAKLKYLFQVQTLGENYSVCDRCVKIYEVDPVSGFPMIEQECQYHWGRKWNGSPYTCCAGVDHPLSPTFLGCTKCHTHIPITPIEIPGFVSAIREGGEAMGMDPWDIVAIDCELVYTTWGQEVGRVSIIGADKSVLYDSFVRPSHPVIDYNTGYSGINAHKLAGVSTTLEDVQAVILAGLKKNSIIIGHSLESDLFGLKLKHDYVVDTTVLMPHKKGRPFKRALKNLSWEFLGKIIQTGEGITGHDSMEDALTAYELVLWKIDKAEQKKSFNQTLARVAAASSSFTSRVKPFRRPRMFL